MLNLINKYVRVLTKIIARTTGGCSGIRAMTKSHGEKAAGRTISLKGGRIIKRDRSSSKGEGGGKIREPERIRCGERGPSVTVSPSPVVIEGRAPHKGGRMEKK